MAIQLKRLRPRKNATFKKNYNWKFFVQNSFCGRRGLTTWAKSSRRGSISGEDKGGMGFPFRFKKFLGSPKRRRRPKRSGVQKILKIDLLEALRMGLNFFNFFAYFRPSYWLKTQVLTKFCNFQKIQNNRFWQYE